MISSGERPTALAPSKQGEVNCKHPRILDSDLKAPYTINFSASVERQRPYGMTGHLCPLFSQMMQDALIEPFKSQSKITR
jgi:hypothetical protein